MVLAPGLAGSDVWHQLVGFRKTSGKLLSRNSCYPPAVLFYFSIARMCEICPVSSAYFDVFPLSVPVKIHS
ncbi:hypothetical protein DWZ38_03140 [Ruminococcus sp. AF31-8BH]|nr:hypothetical protein DWZ38_03140 [Ruminococcus sp. AF31-8BH]